MNNRGRRVRAAIVMGLIWGATWSFAGGLLARLPGFDSDLPFPIMFAPLGFVTGMIFSAILAGFEGRRGFERASLSRFAAWGAVSGLLLSGIFVVGAALRGTSWWGELLLFGPPLALAGAVCAAGSLAVARRDKSGGRRVIEGTPAATQSTARAIDLVRLPEASEEDEESSFDTVSGEPVAVKKRQTAAR